MPNQPKSPREILLEAAELLEKPGAWTQKSAARDKQGRHVLFDEVGAVSFCMIGAISRISNNEYPAYQDAKLALSRVVGRPGIVTFNDAPGRTQSEVVTALRKAAESCGGGE